MSPERIRYWVKRNIVRPSLPYGRNYRFAFNDLLVMRLAKELIGEHHYVDSVQRAFDRVRQLTSPARPLHSIRLVNVEGRIVVSDRGSLIETDTGQLILDFRIDRPAGIIEERFGPARVRERFEEARRLAEDDPLKALTIYSELVSREPGNFEAHMRLATLLEHEGDTAGALRHLLGAAAIVPASADVHLRLATLYRRRGEHQHALMSALRSIDCDPTNVEAHRNAAELYELTGRKAHAQKHHAAIHRLLSGE